MLDVKEKGTDDKVSKEITAVVQNDASVEQAVLDGTLVTDTVNNTLLKPREYISFENKPVYDFFKRVFDIVVSLICLTVGLPFFLIIAIVIVIEDPGNPFFSQMRTGKDNKKFKLLKFRSMHKGAESKRAELLKQNEASGPIFKIANDPRVTKVGRFLRKTSIDELPQLINILKGDMSIIGPRPLPVYEQDACDEYQNQRLLVKPGLSCYTALDKRSEEDFDNWIELDLRYIKERSFKTDFSIIIKTVLVVIRHKNY